MPMHQCRNYLFLFGIFWLCGMAWGQKPASGVAQNYPVKLHVPFKNAGLIVTDLIGGRIDATLGAFITVQAQAVAGRLRILGIAREARAPNYPQFPTLGETGVPGFASGGWFGAIGPAGMPKDVIALLNREMNAALKAPDVREKGAILGLDLHTEPPEFFSKTIRDDFDKWGKLARDVNFKPQ